MSMPAAETRCATPFIASRSGHVTAYRLAGIRRRGLAESDPRYWFVEFNPKSGLGIVSDQPGRFSLQRGFVEPAGERGMRGGLHFVRLVRADGQIYWEGHCLLGERELELAWLKIEGDRETPYVEETDETARQAEANRFWSRAAWFVINSALLAAFLFALIKILPHL